MLSVVLGCFSLYPPGFHLPHHSLSLCSTVADTFQLQAFNFYSELNFYRTCCCGIVFVSPFYQRIFSLFLFIYTFISIFIDSSLYHFCESTAEHQHGSALSLLLLLCTVIYNMHTIEMHTIIFHLISLVRVRYILTAHSVHFTLYNNLCMCCAVWIHCRRHHHQHKHQWNRGKINTKRFKAREKI